MPYIFAPLSKLVIPQQLAESTFLTVLGIIKRVKGLGTPRQSDFMVIGSVSAWANNVDKYCRMSRQCRTSNCPRSTKTST